MQGRDPAWGRWGGLASGVKVVQFAVVKAFVTYRC